MSLPALATPTELGVWVDQTIDSADARAQALLDAASAEVRAAAGLDWMNTADPPTLGDVPQIAKTVTLDAAKRAWVNPTGAKRQGTGPFSAEFDTSGIFLTVDEAARVAALNTTDNRVGGIGTLSTTRGPIETGTVLDCDPEGYSGITEADDPYLLWGIAP